MQLEQELKLLWKELDGDLDHLGLNINENAPQQESDLEPTSPMVKRRKAPNFAQALAVLKGDYQPDLTVGKSLVNAYRGTPRFPEIQDYSKKPTSQTRALFENLAKDSDEETDLKGDDDIAKGKATLKEGKSKKRPRAETTAVEADSREPGLTEYHSDEGRQRDVERKEIHMSKRKYKRTKRKNR